MPGTLYIVATPIGNLGDLTHRAEEILRTVGLVACEDTRQTRKLLNHYGIAQSLVSLHDFNERAVTDRLVATLQTTSVALVSDAGTPTISDPGQILVHACRSAGIPVVPIPGPSALIAALSASGFAADEFWFAGFLPAKTGSRRTKLAQLAGVTAPLAFYEAPHRIVEMLADVEAVLGDREACVAREVTKVHETFLTGRLSVVRPRVNPRGEFVVVIAGSQAAPAPTHPELARMSRNEALKYIAEQLRVPRADLYAALFERK